MYILPKTINHLFLLSLVDIKKHAFHLAQSASKIFEENDFTYASQENFFELFERKFFAEFFFYNYDRIYKANKTRKSTQLKLDAEFDKEKPSTLRLNSLGFKLSKLDTRIRKLETDAHKRLMNPDYAKRKLVRLVMNEMLYIAQKEKSVGAGSVYYAPEMLVNLRKLQKEYNEELLASRAIIIDGQAKSLASFATNANRKVSELYAKTKGLEVLAHEQGMKWAFLTLTAPGEYHPNPSKLRSSSWNKANARASHKYLSDCWKALGKAYSKKGYSMRSGEMFGLRVTEPHKDGCAHWHMVCFYQPRLESLLFDKSEGLFFKKFGHSNKAIQITFGQVEGEGVASAASYCFKYITKALSGDLEDVITKDQNLRKEHTSNSIERIESWRAATGIRAYQPFGIQGLSTIWNATRKLSSQTGLLDSFKDIEQFKHFYILESPFNENDALQELDALPTKEENLKASLSQYDSIDEELSSHLDLQIQLTISNANLHSNISHKCPSRNHLDEELQLTLKLNDFSNGFEQALETEYMFRQLMKSAVSGDWASFYKQYRNYSENLIMNNQQPIQLVRESYLNQYDEIKSKVIGINTGIWVYLFKKYTIVKMKE
ncbi:replication endonuclease [Vibrio splendidus]|uniref:replication endonuclease n=1 Tax=Vibrio splendidus TaxID=29497 RepID=UPI000CB87CCA|nr:replication endonuclease [Vibrio splendidus]PMH00953.1 hypothetical protein BCU77_17615 [Vibrio splendidus]